MAFHAVLFDLDGTLLDTLDDLADATNCALRELGFPEHPVDAFKHFIGDGVENLIRRAVPVECHDPETLHRCGQRMRQQYAECWAAKTRPYDGVGDLLDVLTVRRVPMAILSNKPDEFTKLCVAKLLPRWHFEAVLGAGERLPKKPDPAGALEIAAQLKLPPAAFLYLGDTDTDMQTATAAGMFPVGALWGFRTAEELTAHGAQALLERPQELVELLTAGRLH